MTTLRLLTLALLLCCSAPALASPQVVVGQGSEVVESFENGPAGWTTDGNLWEVALPAQTQLSSAFSGFNAWVTDANADYPSGVDTSVTSPVYDFSALTSDPFVQVAVNYACEFFFDGFRLEADFGAGFETIGEIDPSWYIGALSANSLGGVGFSGGSGGWDVVSRELVGAAGNPAVTFRIRFGSDGTVAGEGVAFDDFRITPADVACSGTESGAGDDLTQELRIDGVAQGPGFIHDLVAGEMLEIATFSPNGSLVGNQLFAVGEVLSTGGVPTPLFPGLCVSGAQNTFVVDLLGVPLPASEYAYSFVYPGGFVGTSFFLQSVVISASAANGLFASTDAREVRFQ